MTTEAPSRPDMVVPAQLTDGSQARRAVWGLVLFGVLLRIWVVGAGWFYWDDYIFQGRAYGSDLTLGYLTYAHDGHLMPGAFALQWPITRAWPFGYTPIAATMILGQVLLVTATAKFFLMLWGARWATTVAVAIAVVTPLTLPTNTWWAAALNGIPMQLSLVLMLMAVLHWTRTGRRWPLPLAFVSWVLLLTFTEKAVLVPWVVLAAVPVFTSAGIWKSIRNALRRGWALWAAAALVTVAYATGYITLVGKAPSADASPSQIAEVLTRGFVGGVAPAILGGPLDWDPVGYGSAVGSPPIWLSVVAVELLVVLVVSTMATSRRSAYVWIWAAMYLVGDLTLVALGRLNPAVDPVIVAGLRYTADAAVPLALAVGSSLVAVSPAAKRALRRWAPGAPADVLRTTAISSVIVMLLLSSASTARYREIWSGNESRPWVTNAIADLAAAASGPSLIDQPVAPQVLYGLAYPYNQASWLLGPASPRPAFTDPTTQLRVFDADGRLRPALVEGVTSPPGPTPGCGWALKGSGDIPLTALVIPFSHTVRVGYLASAAGAMTLELPGGEPRPVQIQAGLGEVVLTLSGGGAYLRITSISPGVTVCVDAVQVGQPKAIQP